MADVPAVAATAAVADTASAENGDDLRGRAEGSAFVVAAGRSGFGTTPVLADAAVGQVIPSVWESVQPGP